MGPSETRDFLVALAGYAGTVFAITLAARTISPHREAKESPLHNRTRLWDSVSVTFELAAAALIALLFLVARSWLAEFYVSLVLLTGLALYGLFAVSFWKLWRSGEKVPKSEHVWAWTSILPSVAYVLIALGLWVPGFDTQLTTAAITWLAFSGTIQALFWYVSSWEHPS
jgi:hypothetical protein